MDSVIVDGRRVFKPGQLGVGIGRVRHKEDLCLINFSATKCTEHPPNIREFYDRPFQQLQADLTCCRSPGMLWNFSCLFNDLFTNCHLAKS